MDNIEVVNSSLDNIEVIKLVYDGIQLNAGLFLLFDEAEVEAIWDKQVDVFPVRIHGKDPTRFSVGAILVLEKIDTLTLTSWMVVYVSQSKPVNVASVTV